MQGAARRLRARAAGWWSEDPERDLRPALARAALMTLASATIALEHGFYQAPLSVLALRGILFALIALHAAITAHVTLLAVDRGERARGLALFGVLALGLAASAAGQPNGWRLVEAAVVLRFFMELWALNVVLSHRFARPEALFPLSFVLLIVLGTILLKLPKAVPQGYSIGWIDALFTSTSAVCVTGLTVRSTAHEFTLVGQVIICMLIQLGGLGIIMFGSTLMMLLGRNLSLRENRNLSQMLSDQPVHRLMAYARFVLTTTILIELAGAMLLYPLWAPAAQGEPVEGGRLWLSVFHSVSAFCNAGFDITGASMTPERYTVVAQGVIAPLIVLGGLGFPVLDNLMRVVRARAHRALRRGALPPGYSVADARLSLHTRLALWTSAALYLYGVVAIALAQVAAAVEPLPAGEALSTGEVAGHVMDASFMSVAARTAGFNTIPMADLEPGSVFTLMTLMLIGGSPGSTAGGMKTTTLAVLVL
ncbi:MAG TPA: potassium transporter TrkG, partial [Phycisphaerales bacterium]|nr:potassium transporter TrkG [Phycisphaerales bacterium]